MKINKLIYMFVCIFVTTNISNASNNNSIFGNVINELNPNNKLLLNNNQTKSNINNNDAETLSGDNGDDYRAKYLAECDKKNIEITFGNSENNIPYKVTVNDIYNSSSNSKNFSSIKKLVNNLNDITNDVLSSQKGIMEYNKKTKIYKYTLDDIKVDYYNLNSLTLNGNDSKNPSIVNLIFNISNLESDIPFNNIKCNNISKLNLSFKNNKNPFTYCKINNITTNNNMNITSDIPVCIGNSNEQYFNYSNNSVEFNINTGHNVIEINPFYLAIQKFNNVFLNVFNGNNINEILTEYHEALEDFSSENIYYNKSKKLNLYKYKRAIRILCKVMNLSHSELETLKGFYNIHRIFSNNLYNVLK